MEADLVRVLPDMTRQDKVVLENLLEDMRAHAKTASAATTEASTFQPTTEPSDAGSDAAGDHNRDDADVERLRQRNDPGHADFEPTVFAFIDLPDLRAMLPASVDRLALQPFIRWAQTVVRHEADVVIVSHLLLYLCTILPSAVLLFRHFSYLHAAAHVVMAVLYIGPFATMSHQHMHQGGVLARRWRVVDRLFPCVLGPLMGQTWNSFYYHHKMHHIEDNGPDDRSSTLLYQRDSALHFLHYFARFMLLVWIDLPLYYVSKGRHAPAAGFLFWEMLTFACWGLTAALGDARATLAVFALPCFVLRLGLMLANWCQHACIDREDPTHDLRCSLTLIDVASNRVNFNDGYHAEHHVNPRRHWRDLPVAFLHQKQAYADNSALVLCGLDYPAFAYRLFTRDYAYLARCLVPMGRQLDMTLAERAEWMRGLTRPFTREEILEKYSKSKAR